MLSVRIVILKMGGWNFVDGWHIKSSFITQDKGLSADHTTKTKTETKDKDKDKKQKQQNKIKTKQNKSKILAVNYSLKVQIGCALMSKAKISLASK